MPTGIGGEVLWLCPSLDDAGNDTTTLNDLSGNGNNSTLTDVADAAASWVEDTDAGGIRAVDLLGEASATTDRIVTPVYLATGQNVTISMWLKGDAWTADTRFYCPSSFATINQIGIRVITSGQVEVWTGGSAWLTLGTGFGVGTWRHLAITFDTNCTAYFDGVEKNTVAETWKLDAAAKMVFSGRFSGFGTGFDGRMDDIRVFNRILTGDEITALASMRGYQPPAGGRPRISGSLVSGDFNRGSLIN